MEIIQQLLESEKSKEVFYNFKFPKRKEKKNSKITFNR
jgi:hypothetical protein